MSEHKSESTALPALREPDMVRLAEELVASATDRGIALTGEGGLLTELTRKVLQSALEAEMSHHLGYDRHDPMGRGSGNSRNGSTPKTVTTEIGKVTVDVPRDRDGSFDPRVVPKHQRRLAGFDDAVISLYGKGMTTGDIAGHLSEVYDSDVSSHCHQQGRRRDEGVAVATAGPGLAGDHHRRDRVEGPKRAASRTGPFTWRWA